MEVEYGLTRSRSTIGHNPKVFQALQSRHLIACQKASGEDLSLIGLRISQCDNGLFWNHQDMGGSHGINIPKGQANFILVNDVGGQFSVDYFRKNGCHGLPLSLC